MLVNGEIQAAEEIMVLQKSGLVISVMLVLGIAWGSAGPAMAKEEQQPIMTTKQVDDDLAKVRQGRILFSHHSVGANIISGIQQLEVAVPPESRVRLASLAEAAASVGPMLIHFSGGDNGEPKTKIDAFAATIRSNAQLKPDLALVKLCYVDFNPGTDVNELFRYYRHTLDALKRDYPGILFAHLTVPLTRRPTGLKWTLYRLIGKEVWEDAANARRSEFNRLLRDGFGSDPVFDLAGVEATAPDGSLTTFDDGGHKYPSLYPGYAQEDGEHLNQAGQRVAGAAFLHFLAEALRSHGQGSK
jgi:hypothetical protein